MAAPDGAHGTVLALPFNSRGARLRRNAAIAAVTTPYVMVTDDDVVE